MGLGAAEDEDGAKDGNFVCGVESVSVPGSGLQPPVWTQELRQNLKPKKRASCVLSQPDAPVPHLFSSGIRETLEENRLAYPGRFSHSGTGKGAEVQKKPKYHRLEPLIFHFPTKHSSTSTHHPWSSHSFYFNHHIALGFLTTAQ